MFSRMLLMVGIVIFLAGCGGSSKTTGQPGSESEEIDELSKLLGLNDETTKKEASSEEKYQSTEEPNQEKVLEIAEPAGGMGEKEKELEARVNELQEQIQELEAALETKSLKIDELFAELSIKDEKIEELQNTMKGAEEPLKGNVKKTIPKLKVITPKNPVSEPAGQASYSASLGFKTNYDNGLNEFKSKRYSNAIVIFEQLLAQDKTTDLSDNCQFWIGESYFALGNYQQSLVDFQKVFLFSGSNKKDDAQFKIGRCYMMLGNNAKAVQAFNDLITDYPDSEYVSKAQEYLASLNQ